MAVSKVDAANQIENKLPQANIANNAPFRNIIINGDMSIAQRGTSTTGITGNDYDTVDRFKHEITSLGTWTMSQETDVPSGQGFSNSLKMECTVADASPAAGDVCLIGTKFEGQFLQYLKKGTASAQKLTASFWVKSSKTGTYILELRDVDNERTTSKSYTVDTADTWEKKTITYDADTTGAFGNDNGQSLQVNFWLGAGTNFTSGTLATTWESKTNANRAVGQVNLAGTVNDDWYITGVQLEAGDTASDFEFLPYDVTYQRCKRYYWEITRGAGKAVSHGRSNGSATSWTEQIAMRATPSLVQGSNSNDLRCVTTNNVAFTSFTGMMGESSSTIAGCYTGNIGSTAGAAFFYTNSGATNALVAFDAEL